MLKEFRAFIERGNVVDFAVAVVIGAAFGAVVTSLVENLLTPLIAIPGTADFSEYTFTIDDSTFFYGRFVNALISFLSIAAAVFFLVVRPLNRLAERRKRGAEPRTKECPECLSEIPIAAKRCAHCTTKLAARRS